MEALQERICVRLLHLLGDDRNADIQTLAGKQVSSYSRSCVLRPSLPEDIAFLIRKRCPGGVTPEEMSVPIMRSYNDEGSIRCGQLPISCQVVLVSARVIDD
jgi:hypothetical protein